MTITYEPERNRFNMPTDAGDAYVTIRWDGDVMILPHAEVPSALRGTGAGARPTTRRPCWRWRYQLRRLPPILPTVDASPTPNPTSHH